MLSIPGTILVTKKPVDLEEEPKEKPSSPWGYSYIAGTTFPELTALMLLEIKVNPRPNNRKATHGSKRQKILRFLHKEKYYRCEMSDHQINRFFGLMKDYEKIKKTLEYQKEQQKKKK